MNALWKTLALLGLVALGLVAGFGGGGVYGALFMHGGHGLEGLGGILIGTPVGTAIGLGVGIWAAVRLRGPQARRAALGAWAAAVLLALGFLVAAKAGLW